MSSPSAAVSVAPRFRLVPPAASSAGPEAIELAASAGLILDPWQQDAVSDLLLEDETGLWAATVAALIEQRQNGKGAVLEARELAGLVLFDEEITHSAHRFDTSLSAHQRLLRLFEDTPDLDRLVKKVLHRPTPMIRLKSGAVITFRTRTAHGARGLTGDVVVLDEAYNIGPGVMAALVPTMSARPNLQLIYTSSAPRPGPESEQLRNVCRRGRSGRATRMVYIEHSADPDEYRLPEEELQKDPTRFPIDVTDERAWRAANPGYVGVAGPEHDHGITRRAVELELAEMPPEEFALERLGIWFDDEAATTSADTFELWLQLADPSAEQGSGVVFGVDVGTDRMAHVAAAWRRPGGLVHVTVAETNLSPLRTPARIAELAQKWRGPVMLGGTSAFLDDDVRASTVLSAGEFAAACGRFQDLIDDRVLRHDNVPELNTAVRDAYWRPFGSSGDRTLQLRDAPTVAPLAATVRAIHGLLSGAGTPPAKPQLVSAARSAPRSSSSDLSTVGF